MSKVNLLFALLAVLILPAPAIAQQNAPDVEPDAPSATPTQEPMQGMMQGMQGMMRGMQGMMDGMQGMMQRMGGTQGQMQRQEMMQRMHEMMQGMHQAMGGMQGTQGDAQDTQACILRDPEGGFSALLAGPIAELSLTDVQRVELDELLARAQEEALGVLTSEQREILASAPPATGVMCSPVQIERGGGGGIR
jgi:hypothetical protein